MLCPQLAYNIIVLSSFSYNCDKVYFAFLQCIRDLIMSHSNVFYKLCCNLSITIREHLLATSLFPLPFFSKFKCSYRFVHFSLTSFGNWLGRAHRPSLFSNQWNNRRRTAAGLFSSLSTGLLNYVHFLLSSLHLNDKDAKKLTSNSPSFHERTLL